MKNTLSLVALAAGISQVIATGFHDAPKFTCPDNTDNTCLPDYSGGLDWSDLPFGGFNSYKGFKWTGFTCADKFGKRDELSPRTSFQSKCITGTASSDKNSSPKISCDKSKGNDKTSIKTFQVTPKFDCDLEFHYTMPDGSSCKHRSSCKASGTTVENTQCGGATDVTVVYPPQPNKPKSCDFGIHHIGFDCNPHKPTTSKYPVSTPSSSYVVSIPSSSSVVTTSSVATYPASSSSVSSSSSAVTTSSYVVDTTSSYVIGTTSSSVETTSSAVETTSSYVVDTTSSTVETTSSAVETTSSYVVDTTSSSAAVSTTSSAAVSSYSVTSYLTTSTVFTTSVQTITSCGPTVPNCPASSTVLTTVTIPVSTTICPVTETLSVSTSLPIGSSTYAVSSPAESTPAVSSTTVVASSSTSPAGPVETLPCPGVVPSCLNTWMFSVGCKDNTDSACYCPDAAFVKNIFTCLYAYGESDDVISEAISYFQGICAPYVPTNPGIATGAETITTILTATPITYPAAVTTIEVATTVVVPCTNEAGETIPSSSSTVTISTSLTVPGVIFTTVTSGPSSTGVVVVPGTYSATVPAATPILSTATSTPAGGAPLYPTAGASTTLFTTAPAGTGGVYPSSPASTTSIVTAGAANVGAGMGLVGFAGMIVAAFL
ncbi:hypothetical protein Hte_012181 [Hypoxylon texense]